MFMRVRVRVDMHMSLSVCVLCRCRLCCDKELPLRLAALPDPQTAMDPKQAPRSAIRATEMTRAAASMPMTDAMAAGRSTILIHQRACVLSCMELEVKGDR